MKMKKKVLLSSLATIALCLCLIAGSTFALFTSKIETNISVNAGKVELYATVDSFKMYSVQADENGEEVDENGYTYTYVDVTADGEFANGGTATCEDGVIDMKNITPGDKVEFTFAGENKSNVAIQYRYVIECLDGLELMSGLVVSVGPDDKYESISSYSSGWTKLAAEAAINDSLVMSIELPVDAGNEYQEKAAKIRVAVEAVQGNAVVEGGNTATVTTFTKADDAAELQSLLNAGGTVVLGADIAANETITVAAGAETVLDLNGHTISAEVETPAADSKGYALIANKGALTITGDGEIAVNYVGTPSTAIAINTIRNEGVLTVEGGKISNVGTGDQIGYAIDNYGGSQLIVNGGEIVASGSSYYDGIRLFCGRDAAKEITVTINGGVISSVWAQNPSNNKADQVYGTVIVNGGTIGAVYYENYTIVKAVAGVTVTPYGAGSDNTTTAVEGDYTVYSFVNA